MLKPICNTYLILNAMCTYIYTCKNVYVGACLNSTSKVLFIINFKHYNDIESKSILMKA